MATSGTSFAERRSIGRSHRPPFTTAPVADSQRSSDPLLFITSAREDSQRRWLSRYIRNAMDDPYDLILSMFALAVTAVMLVAGALYLVTRPEPSDAIAPPASNSIIAPVSWLPTADPETRSSVSTSERVYIAVIRTVSKDWRADCKT